MTSKPNKKLEAKIEITREIHLFLFKMGLQFGQFLQQFVFTPIVELLLTNQSFTIHEGRRAIDTRGKAKPGHVLSFSNTTKN